MTLANLAAVSGVSVRSITAFENGHKQPSIETLDSLARALDFPTSFFSQYQIDDIPLPAVSFRALSKMTAIDRESAIAAGQISMTVNAWIESNFRLPEMRVPNLAGVDPEQAASRLRGLWGLGEQPIPNMVHLLEANGVRVFSLASDCISVDAFSIFRRGTPFAFLNTTKSGERGRFDAAHELGHLVLHGGDRAAYGTEAEDEAKQICFRLTYATVRAIGSVNCINTRSNSCRQAAMEGLGFCLCLSPARTWPAERLEIQGSGPEAIAAGVPEERNRRDLPRDFTTTQQGFRRIATGEGTHLARGRSAPSQLRTEQACLRVGASRARRGWTSHPRKACASAGWRPAQVG